MTEQNSAAPRGRPKDPAKRQAILDAAKELFLTHGFAGTSMDAVAAAAEVSKLTVYSHFSDKETLFSSAVEAKCKGQMPPPIYELKDGAALEESLQRIGEAFVTMVNSEDAVRLLRIMCAMEPQDTEMARLFFEAGPQRNLGEMESFLRSAQELGLLELDDPAAAAEQFFGMLTGCSHTQVLIGCREAPDKDEVREWVEKTVGIFLRCCGR